MQKISPHVLPDYSAVMSKLGFHLVEGKVARVRTGQCSHMVKATANGLLLTLPAATGSEPMSFTFISPL